MGMRDITVQIKQRLFNGLNNTSSNLWRKIIMIRALQKADIDSVTDIWLDTNLKAHDSIPAQYWNSNYDLVK